MPPSDIRRDPPFSKRTQSFERRGHGPAPPCGRRESAAAQFANPARTLGAIATGCSRRPRRRLGKSALRRASRRSRAGQMSGSGRFIATSRPGTRSSRRSIAARFSNWPRRRRASSRPCPRRRRFARGWRLFVDYIAAKKVIAPALKSSVGGGSAVYADSSARINEAIALLVERARASGDIRPERGCRRSPTSADRLRLRQFGARLGGERASPHRPPDRRLEVAARRRIPAAAPDLNGARDEIKTRAHRRAGLAT